MLHESVSESWLEFDLSNVERKPKSLPTPSVFVSFHPSRPELAPAAVQTILEMLVDEDRASLHQPMVERLHGECSGPARLSHVGVMLARPEPALRLHVSEIPLRDLRGYLGRIGWCGDVDEAESLGRLLLEFGDLLIACFDIVEDLTPRLGLECFFDHRQGVDPRWGALLSRLTELGLCVSEKADALLAWPGAVTPLEASAPWPGDLIASSLQRSPDLLGLIERRLSHVKLALVPGVPVMAKAYFGYGHVWSRAGPPVSAAARPRPKRRSATTLGAVSAGVECLLRLRNQAGFWRDFFDRMKLEAAALTAAEASDEWVTAYVGSALATLSVPGAPDAAREALELLLKRREGAVGWGYSALLAPDADTTTWVLRLARGLGRPELGQLAAGRGLIERLTDSEGGVSTYSEQAAAHFARVMSAPSHAGWCAPHVCVTAASAVLEPSPETRQYLVGAQAADGSWTGYWWEDAEYATARAVEALANRRCSEQSVSAALDWCSRRVGADGAVSSATQGGPSPFATALALQALRVGAGGRNRARWTDAAERAERWLVENQLEDGSWEPSAYLRIPPPSALEPETAPEVTKRFVDERRRSRPPRCWGRCPPVNRRLRSGPRLHGATRARVAHSGTASGAVPSRTCAPRGGRLR